jgi:hypothetical protein
LKEKTRGEYFERENIMKRGIVHCLALVVCLLWAGAASAQSWDLYNDMSFTANPAGAWSYGLGALLPNDDITSIPNTSTLVLCDKIWDLSNSAPGDVNISVKKWGLASLPNPDAVVVRHTTENDGHIYWDKPADWMGVPRGQAGLQPGAGNGNYPVVARWTSPIAGTVQVHGSFGTCIWGMQSGRWIKHNSTVKVSQPTANSGPAFDFIVTVAVGDKIDFIVTQGLGQYNDATTLIARIDTAPNWDVYKDMNIGTYSNPTGNPSGQWSYGYGTLLADEDDYSVPDTSALVLFNKVADLSDCAAADVNQSVKKWHGSAISYPPAVIKHTYELDGHMYWADPNDWQGIHRGQVGLVPGPFGSNYPVVARWTSPIAGFIQVSGSFGQCIWGQESGRWIKLNSTVKYSQPSMNAEESFDFTATVAVGDKIDFIATQGLGQYNDATALVAQIVMPVCSGLSQGAYLLSDLNHDCYVTFADFAIFAQNWLTCNDPQNPACTYTP